MADEQRSPWERIAAAKAGSEGVPSAPEVSGDAEVRSQTDEGSVAEGSVAEGSVAEGSVAEGSVAEGSVAEGSPREGSPGEGSSGESSSVGRGVGDSSEVVEEVEPDLGGSFEAGRSGSAGMSGSSTDSDSVAGVEEQGRKDRAGGTGVPDVDAVIERLDELDTLPVSEHPDAYDDAHRRLHETLRDASDPAAGPMSGPGSASGSSAVR